MAETKSEGGMSDKKEMIEDDGFTTVIRRRPKRLIRAKSSETNIMGEDLEKKIKSNFDGNQKACIAALENLPKRIAMAKLLHTEKMNNVKHIKYKELNNVIIPFNTKEGSRHLMGNGKVKEMQFHCQCAYGVVKGINLDLSEEDIFKNVECDIPIMAVQRLKKLAPGGSQWVDSETIKVTFKGVLPRYVNVYGRRFGVRTYVFPVMQCVCCWKLTHSRKYCRLMKPLCPKCGSNEHDNCPITAYKCLNCQGNHFVLDKNCPLRLREKEIRRIMGSESLSYNQALQVYIDKMKNTHSKHQEITVESTPPSGISLKVANEKETYSSVLTKAVIHKEQKLTRKTKSVAWRLDKASSQKDSTYHGPNRSQNPDVNRTQDESLWQKL